VTGIWRGRQRRASTGALLDAHLDAGVQTGRRQRDAAPRLDRRGVAARRAYVLGDADPAVHARGRELLGAEGAERAAGPDERHPEPLPLLAAHPRHLDVPRRHHPGVLQRADCHQPRDHASGAVEVAAARDRVEVGLDDNGRRRAVGPRQRHEGIPRGVDLHLGVAVAVTERCARQCCQGYEQRGHRFALVVDGATSRD
jgi:hypothetical protein